MNMALKTIDAMTNDEFDNVLGQIGRRNADMLGLSAFMETVWDIRSKRAASTIELTAKLVDDRIELKAPEGIPVKGNEIIVGNHRIIVHWSNA
jgi:hypothetical protein